MSKTLQIQPIISEKSYFLAGSENTYIIEVPKAANKLMIKDSVESQYGVTVESVRTATLKGKTKQSPSRRSRPKAGKRKDTKRAYVTLKDGDKIDAFEGVDES